jgi:hypothetical protein
VAGTGAGWRGRAPGGGGGAGWRGRRRVAGTGAGWRGRAVEAAARGYAMLLLDDGPDPEPDVVERAAERTARAILAPIDGRRLLG